MKTRTLLLASLALNALFLGGILLHPRMWERTAPLIAREFDEASTVVAVDDPNVVAEDPKETPGRITGLRWASVESTNYVDYVANLRAIGCPEATIRDIIAADLTATVRQASGEKRPESSNLIDPQTRQLEGLVNQLLGSQEFSAAGTAQGVASTPETSEYKDGSELTKPVGQGSEDPAAKAEARRKRLEALRRTWLVDSIRARYGIEALLEWQYQAVSAGLTFEEYVQRSVDRVQ